MCGRYTLTTGDLDSMRLRFGLDERVELRRRFNVAPGDEVVAVAPTGPTLLRWGFLRDNAYSTINARAESVLERPSWRGAMKDGRCLILADGFYEWCTRPDGSKQPHWITRADHAPFAFAGLASSWGTCAIVTTEATPGLAGIHPRMPAMLDQDAEEAWLEPRLTPAQARDLLAPFADVAVLAVGTAVNDARYDGPECLEPAPPPPPTLF